MALVLEDHVFRVLENQLRLYELLGEHRWDFNMDQGSLVFSTSAPGGVLKRLLAKVPRVLATCPVQLIGSESDADATWLWAWANAQSQIPEHLLRGVEQVRDEARSQNRPEFVEASPIPLRHPRWGAELAIICTGHLGFFTYYACPYPGGALYAALVEAPEGIAPQRTARQAVQCMAAAISTLTFDHRPAVLAYLGEPAGQEGDTMRWSLGSEPVQISFDDQGRIANMTTRPGTPP